MTPSQYITSAWDLMKKDWGVLFGGSILLGLIEMLGGAVPFGSLILHGPLMVGIMYVYLRAIRGESYQFNDLFKGFDYFGESIIAALLIFAVSLGAVLCCILPVFFITPFLFYPFAFIIDKKMSGIDAFKASWNLVKADYGRHLVLFLLIIGLNLIGLLLCVVGLFFTTVIGAIAIAVAYNDLVPKEEAPQVVEPMAPANWPQEP